MKLLGPQPIKYYPKESYQAAWNKLANVPEPYVHYWTIHYKGNHVGELFRGKSGYIGFIFGQKGFVAGRLSDIELHLVGGLINKGQ